MLTRSEVAVFLGIKPHSLNTMLSDGRMVPPDEGQGRSALWSEESLLRWQETRPGRGKRRRTAIERFMAKVSKDPSGCWIWQGHIGTGGYGTFRISQDKRGPAHRRGYELLVGPIPDGLQIDHLCRVRACVNPDHLEAVTSRENSLRAPLTFQARNAAKTHCPQGHPYDEANTQIRKGGRNCRECRRASFRRWYYRSRAASSDAVPSE